MDVLPTPLNLIGIDGQPSPTGYAGPGFASVSLEAFEPILHSKYSSGRYDMSRAAFHHTWKVNISYNELECQEFHTIYAFLLNKQETMSPFYVKLPQYLNQSGLADKNIVSGGGWGNNTVVINVGSDHITPGTVFSTSDEKFYYVTRVETNTDYWSPEGAPGAGNERLHVSPTFQETIVGSIDFTEPTIKVRTASELGYSLNAEGFFSFSLQLEEIRDYGSV